VQSDRQNMERDAEGGAQHEQRAARDCKRRGGRPRLGVCVPQLHCVRAQIMLLWLEAVQVTRPKFGKLGDALDHHDPSISCLKGGGSPSEQAPGLPLPRAERARHDERALPVSASPLRRRLVQHLKPAVISASSWSQLVETKGLPVRKQGAHGALLRRASRALQLDAGNDPGPREPAAHPEGHAECWHGLLGRAQKGSGGFHSIP
jgi:hypothetical protein